MHVTDNSHRHEGRTLTEIRAFIDLLHHWNMPNLEFLDRMAATELAHTATQALPSNLSSRNCRPQRCRHLQGESSICLGRSVRWREAIARRRRRPVHVVAHVFVRRVAMRVEVPRLARPRFHRRVEQMP